MILCSKRYEFFLLWFIFHYKGCLVVFYALRGCLAVFCPKGLFGKILRLLQLRLFNGLCPDFGTVRGLVFEVSSELFCGL